MTPPEGAGGNQLFEVNFFLQIIFLTPSRIAVSFESSSIWMDPVTVHAWRRNEDLPEPQCWPHGHVTLTGPQMELTPRECV